MGGCARDMLLPSVCAAVRLDDFTALAVRNPAALALARRFTVIDDGNPDPNALAPQRARMDLADGRTVGCAVDRVFVSPERRLSTDLAKAKLIVCWGSARVSPANAARSISYQVLETVDQIRSLIALRAPGSPTE
jgi:hypothetical protein